MFGKPKKRSKYMQRLLKTAVLTSKKDLRQIKNLTAIFTPWKTASIGSPEACSPPKHACWVLPVRVASRYHSSAFSHFKSFLHRQKVTAVKTIWYHSFTHNNLKTLLNCHCLLEWWLRWNLTLNKLNVTNYFTIELLLSLRGFFAPQSWRLLLSF